MDIENFYHRVSPRFLVRSDFLSTIGLELASSELLFTEHLLKAIATWYHKTPDALDQPKGAIPVGLSASKIIANVLLVQFDRLVIEKLEPIYYGRYVDDIFLVIKACDGDMGAKRVTERIVDALSSIVKVKKQKGETDSLSLHLPYAKDSNLVFAGRKQKIFSLSSAHGADLIHHIRDQIRQQSSEYRLLPVVPATGVAMASRALLASSSASLQADALRKADVVSVRRLGFSLLLSDIETYASDLKPQSWSRRRKEFYELVDRHIITPVGFFDYFVYIPRVFGLMVACGDLKEAFDLIAKLKRVSDLLKGTTNLGDNAQTESYALCMEQYAQALLEAGVRAATLFQVTTLQSGLLKLFKGLGILSPKVRVSRTVSSLQSLTIQVLLADWGRRPYKDYWIQEQSKDEVGPPIPKMIEVRKKLRLGAVKRFRERATNLKRPHWPALAFPTRPLRVDEIGLVAQDVFTHPQLFRQAIKLLRGAEVPDDTFLGYEAYSDDSPIARFRAAGRPRDKVRIAVTSVKTTDKQFESAARGFQDRSWARYEAFNGLLNRILKESKRPDYIIMPELCMPLRWALRAARKLATNGVSLLVGIEYHRDRVTRKLRNDCLVSMTTTWPGYICSAVVLQSKFEPAHGERESLKKVLKKDNQFYRPRGMRAKPTVYEHRGFFFSSLICSDLTNVSHRHAIRGEIDALFALEWNPDTKTFSSLVEATANDLHAYVIQANNRTYGDSRIRAPKADDFARDVVQVKGGIADYYVLGELDIVQLRSEQRRSGGNQMQVKKPKQKYKYKPKPIGYSMSSRRRGH